MHLVLRSRRGQGRVDVGPVIQEQELAAGERVLGRLLFVAERDPGDPALPEPVHEELEPLEGLGRVHGDANRTAFRRYDVLACVQRQRETPFRHSSSLDVPPGLAAREFHAQ